MLNSSNGTVTLERVAKNITSCYVQAMYAVHYLDNSVSSHVISHQYEIKTAQKLKWENN